MRATKQAQTMINTLNIFMEKNNIKEYDDVAIIGVQMLINAGIYAGFNYYVHKEYENSIGEKENILVLAGTCNPDEYDCVQLY